ncbi:hypothetical protein Zm00014a_039347 [Zea mays]|uniref:Uncharacterized protein n=2 Tax=Zea mays TaxID=4577 RepID=A0A979HLK7_MAIZE|nr:hypothetical protein ZEAMMB73_Zm00001d053136 [Zea mays]AQK82820.1 hypothetical protein ZEAMMB73_Zm00001d037090 [Zea mays]AQL03405.1 hypothetical protein ZEAMMB73_Zm00001d045904 [Zea mays]ONM30845.1 hypothetical protein ZEAMMB73_Zm00001d040217 [Zea mays]ONM34467.1 hypothetical protein ZEAMMB73_Zm00001d042077 [Zea mays]
MDIVLAFSLHGLRTEPAWTGNEPDYQTLNTNVISCRLKVGSRFLQY